MDPLSAVVGALTAAAAVMANGIASKAVSDAYDALKGLISTRFHRKSAIEAVEEAPSSPSARQGLEGALKETGAAESQDILKLAIALETALEALGPSKLEKANIDLENLLAGRNLILKNLSASGDITIKTAISDGDLVIDHLNAGVQFKK
jgi:hypothetical protein